MYVNKNIIKVFEETAELNRLLHDHSQIFTAT